MKYLFLFIALLPLHSFSQNSPYRSYVISGSQAVYQQVFDCDSLTGEEIGILLDREVPKIIGVSDYRNNGHSITCKFENAKVDYKRYGRKWGTTPIILNHPFDANVAIEYKDHRFRVTIQNIVFRDQGLGETSLDLFLINNKRQWRRGNNYQIVGGCTEQYFTDLFSFNGNEEW